jgi:hypothetical protein
MSDLERRCGAVLRDARMIYEAGERELAAVDHRKPVEEVERAQHEIRRKRSERLWPLVGASGGLAQEAREALDELTPAALEAGAAFANPVEEQTWTLRAERAGHPELVEIAKLARRDGDRPLARVVRREATRRDDLPGEVRRQVLGEVEALPFPDWAMLAGAAIVETLQASRRVLGLARKADGRPTAPVETLAEIRSEQELAGRFLVGRDGGGAGE